MIDVKIPTTPLEDSQALHKPFKHYYAEADTPSDPVNHPSHYTDGGIETIDFIEAKHLPYHLGNVVKYVSRAGKKDDVLQDLKKAEWYLKRYIDLLEAKLKKDGES